MFFAENAHFSFLRQKNGPSSGLSGGVLVYGECVTPPIPAQYVPQSIVVHDPRFSPRTLHFRFCTRKMELSRVSQVGFFWYGGCATYNILVKYVPQSNHIPNPGFSPRTLHFYSRRGKLETARVSQVRIFSPQKRSTQSVVPASTRGSV